MEEKEIMQETNWEEVAAQLQAENEALRQTAAQTRATRDEQAAFRRAAVERLAAGEEELRQVYGGFSWQREMENPRFAALIGAGVAARDAYEVVHREELMEKAMAYAAAQAGQRMARAIASGARVAENGGRTTAVSRTDPGGLTSEELSDIRRRVLKGEKIRF